MPALMVCGLILFLTFEPPAPGQGDAAKPDSAKSAAKIEQDKMQGKWRIVKIEIGGDQPAPPEEEVRKMRILIKGDRIGQADRFEDNSETFTLDPTKSPKWMDTFKTVRTTFKSVGDTIGDPNAKPPEKPKTPPEEAKKKEKEKDEEGVQKRPTYGIYELNGDRLRICMMGGPDGEKPEKRPKAFPDKAGEGQVVLTLERVKDKE